MENNEPKVIEITENSLILVTVDDTIENQSIQEFYDGLCNAYPNNMIAVIRPGIYLDAVEYNSYKAWLEKELEFINNKLSERAVED